MSCFLSPRLASLLQCTDSIESHLAQLYQFVTRESNRRTAYLEGGGGERGLAFVIYAIRLLHNVRTHQAQAHMRSSGVPKQPFSIQHFKGVLVEAIFSSLTRFLDVTHFQV